MNKKLLDQFTAYLKNLRSDSLEYAQATRAFEELKTALAKVDPDDTMIDAARKAAGLPDLDTTQDSDPELKAIRRAAGLTGQ